MSNLKVIAVTPEAREALDSLPQHVNKGQFLVHFGLVTKSRTIRILVLCNHYNRLMEELGNLKIKDL